MNILLLSVGTRNGIVRSFQRALQGTGRVIASDASKLAPALYEADKYYIVPSLAEEGYLEAVLSLCKRERIAGVLSLIDPETDFLARSADILAQAGTKVIGSSAALCALAADKYRTYRWLERHGYRCARAWRSAEAFFRALEAGEAAFPVFIKPVSGSASVGAESACDKETARFLFQRTPDAMIQEYLAGQEIGADIYADLLSGEVVSVFTKKKLKMRAGETDKSVSFRDPQLFALLERLIRESGFRGPLDIDLFEVDGRYFISEINPRFGGGYPHALAAGCDFAGLILNNLRGIVNKPQIGAYDSGVYMLKYSEALILREETEARAETAAT